MKKSPLWPDLLRAECLPLIDADIGSFGIAHGALPEIILDDVGGVVAHAQL